MIVATRSGAGRMFVFLRHDSTFRELHLHEAVDARLLIPMHAATPIRPRARAIIDPRVLAIAALSADAQRCV